MKKIAVMLLLSSFVFAMAEEGRYPFTPGAKLDIRLKTGGTITITGTADAEAVVKYRVSDSATKTKVDITPVAGGLRIVSESRGNNWSSNKGVDIEIRVPHQVILEFYTAGGEVNLTDLDGTFDGKTMGGELTFKGLIGEVNAKTMGGDVRVIDSEVNGRVRTMGGDIRFKNIIGNIDGSTMGGDVIYDNVRAGDAPEGQGKVVEISTMGGDIEVQDAPFGAQVKTMGGDITVESAAEFVKAKTMGGNIRIKEIDGWVDVDTMGGDVYVNMVGDATLGQRDVTISSKGGYIFLILPKGMSADFEIELAYTKNSKRNYRIVSDFPIQTSETADWAFNWGTPRKVITGTAAGKGGKNKIRIQTINGDVYIKEEGSSLRFPGR